LEEERKKFNVDKFGRYKGGVPNKDNSYLARGKSLLGPSLHHEPRIHNDADDIDPAH